MRCNSPKEVDYSNLPHGFDPLAPDLSPMAKGGGFLQWENDFIINSVRVWHKSNPECVPLLQTVTPSGRRGIFTISVQEKMEVLQTRES